MKRKWTKESAEKYIKNAKQKGLTYLSAMDYLKHHKTIKVKVDMSMKEKEFQRKNMVEEYQV